MRTMLIFVPAFGWQVTTHTFTSVAALIGALNRTGIVSSLATMSHPDIGDLRNVALTLWYETMPNVDHLLMIDADMGFDPQLVLDMLAFGQPIVGGIYRKKSDAVQWAASGLGEDTPAEGRGPFVEVEGLGCGVFLIRRDAVDRMVEVYPDLVVPAQNHALRGLLGDAKRFLRLFDPMEGADGVGRVSEDISFCRRWRGAGGRVWGAGGYALSHIGPKDYGEGIAYAPWASGQRPSGDAEVAA